MIFIGWAILGAITIGFLIAVFLESRMWNKGKCKVCGGEWELFDNDSHCARGYKCGCDRSIWISYPVDKRK